MDQLHDLEYLCMDSDRWYSASHMGRLDELLEDELELDELEEQLGELDEAIMSQTLALMCKMRRSLWIHVKFSTLRDGWFVEG